MNRRVGLQCLPRRVGRHLRSALHGETMARRWTRLATMLGLLFLAYGIGWLRIWNEGIRGDSSLEWLASVLQPPFEARLMVFTGFLLLLAATLSWLIRRFVAKNQRKVTKS
jgi:hypothetical protein